jgi:hypothetical protein
MMVVIGLMVPVAITVLNMDGRAGGATEADEAGAAIEAIQGALAHTKESTTLRSGAAEQRRSASSPTRAPPNAHPKTTEEQGKNRVSESQTQK